jgi:WD40 repeat protein
LVAKFGQNLRSNPSLIHNLIPLVAPKQSRLSQAVQDRPKWLKLVGLASENWDDCVCAIQYKDSWGTCLATGENVFAIGLSDGTVTVYDQSTCQEKFSVSHKSPPETPKDESNSKFQRPPPTVRLLTFDSSDAHFASASVHSICVWSIDGELLRLLSLQEPCVSIRFSANHEELLGITRSSRIVQWSLCEEEDEMLAVPAVQTRRLSTANTRFAIPALPHQAPLAAALSPDQSTLAMLYRGRPVYICSLDNGTVLGICGRDVGSKSSDISVQTAVFNPNRGLSLIAVAYQDGELAIYDIWTQKELVSIDGDAYSLATTPDGRTLGTGNTRGTINLWDFETLCLLYSIRSGFEEIRSLAFSGDGLRVIDIRDSNTRVWEPSALVRRSAEEYASMSDAVALDAPIVGANEEIISVTAMCQDDVGQLIFAGRDDGSVVAYKTITGLLHAHLYSHEVGLFISAIAFREGTIASSDAGGRVIVRKLLLNAERSDSGPPLLLVDMMTPVRQLLFNDDGSRLLIATAKHNAIWDLQAVNSAPKALSSPKPQTPRGGGSGCGRAWEL